jgi:hypothetical protein
MKASGRMVRASKAKWLIRYGVVPFNGWFEERQEASKVVQMHEGSSQMMMKCPTLSVVHDPCGQNESRAKR